MYFLMNFNFFFLFFCKIERLHQKIGQKEYKRGTTCLCIMHIYILLSRAYKASKLLASLRTFFSLPCAGRLLSAPYFVLKRLKEISLGARYNNRARRAFDIFAGRLFCSFIFARLEKQLYIIRS